MPHAAIGRFGSRQSRSWEIRKLLYEDVCRLAQGLGLELSRWGVDGASSAERGLALKSRSVVGKQIVHETIDGETVVINLDSGSYYSMEGSAADLWSRLLAGESLNYSAAALAARHGGDAAAIGAAIADFHRELFDQGLITGQPPKAPTADGELGSFEIPRLHIYNDLRAHLLADPVHDVERGVGWPAVYPGR